MRIHIIERISPPIIAAVLVIDPLAAQTAPPAQGLRMVIQSQPSIGGKCIDVPNAQFVAGAKLQTYDCNNTIAQTYIYDQAAQQLSIGQLCVTSPTNAAETIGLSTCNQALNQKWSMIASGGYYQIVGAGNHCLEVKAGAGGNGVALDAQNCQAGNASQLWTLLQAPSQTQSSGGQAVRSVHEGTMAGTWTLTQKDDGSYTGTGQVQTGNGMVKYNLVVTEQAGIVAASRTNSSDGNDCNFIGDDKNSSISGRYFCKNGGPYSWTAEKK